MRLRTFEPCALGDKQKVCVLCQVDIKKDDTLCIPIAYNPKAIAKNTKLVLLDDLSLVKLAKDMKPKS